MVILLWSTLNVLLLALAIHVIFRLVKALRRRVGLGFALLLLGVFLQSIQFRASTPQNLLPASAAPTANNWTKVEAVRLSFAHSLHLLYEGQATPDTNQIRSLRALMSGLQLGHRWEAVAGSATMGAGGLSYRVVMAHKWLLLGMSVYTTSATYTGTVPVH